MIHWFQTLIYRVGLANFGVIHWFQTFNQLLNTNKNLIHWISHDQSWYLSDGVNITHAEAIWILGTLFIEFHEGRFFTKEDLPCTIITLFIEFMQISDHQIFTLKIPLKCLGLCVKHASFKFLHLKFHSNVWDYVASMQV